jgi:hypothetical protein
MIGNSYVFLSCHIVIQIAHIHQCKKILEQESMLIVDPCRWVNERRSQFFENRVNQHATLKRRAVKSSDSSNNELIIE